MGRSDAEGISLWETWQLAGVRCGSLKYEAWAHAMAQGYTAEEFASPDYPCSQCCFALACTLEGRHDPTDHPQAPWGR